MSSPTAATKRAAEAVVIPPHKQEGLALSSPSPPHSPRHSGGLLGLFTSGGEQSPKKQSPSMRGDDVWRKARQARLLAGATRGGWDTPGREAGSKRAEEEEEGG